MHQDCQGVTTSEGSTKYNKHVKTETRIWKTMPRDTDSALPRWHKQKHFVSTWISLNQHYTANHVTCIHRDGCMLSKLRIISYDRHDMRNPTAFQGAGGLHTAWATNPFSTYGNKLSCSGSAFPWPKGLNSQHYHPGLHRLPSKVASTISFFQAWRMCVSKVTLFLRKKNATVLFYFALHFTENSTSRTSPEVHSSSEIQLNFLHNDFQFCHINVTRSSSFDLNPTPHKSKIQKLSKSEKKVFAYELVSFINSL